MVPIDDTRIQIYDGGAGDIFGERGGDWGSIFLPNKWGIILSILFQIGLFMGVAFFVIFLYVVF